MARHMSYKFVKKIALVFVVAAVCLLGFMRTGDVQDKVKKWMLWTKPTTPAVKARPSYTQAKPAATQPAPSKAVNPTVKLILLTYMRSGSTFTGDLFNHHPEVFYFYEPLWSFDFFFKKGRPARFFFKDSIEYSVTNTEQLSSLQKTTINDVLGCSFWNLSTNVFGMFSQVFSKVKSIACQPFVECFRRPYVESILRKCLPLLVHACSAAKVTVVKTVRFTMRQAEALLKADPNVKVIHLVRDPRGVLRSTEVTGVGHVYHLTGKDLCSKIDQNIKDSAGLRQQYPGRIMTARYEDLSERPLYFTQRLLSFAGLEMTPDLQQYVFNITSSGVEVKEISNTTFRSDSKRTASQWRANGTPFSFVANIDKHCADVYGHMGYFPLHDSRELKNLSVSVYKDVKDVPWLWSP